MANRMTGIDKSVLSDMHKDAYGFRPRSDFWERVERMTDGEVADLFDSLQNSVDYEIEIDRARELRCQKIFEQNIQMWINNGAGDRQTALRWMLDAEGLDIRNSQDVEHLFWTAGVAQNVWPQYMEAVGFFQLDGLWYRNKEIA